MAKTEAAIDALVDEFDPGALRRARESASSAPSSSAHRVSGGHHQHVGPAVCPRRGADRGAGRGDGPQRVRRRPAHPARAARRRADRAGRAHRPGVRLRATRLPRRRPTAPATGGGLCGRRREIRRRQPLPRTPSAPPRRPPPPASPDDSADDDEGDDSDDAGAPAPRPRRIRSAPRPHAPHAPPPAYVFGGGILPTALLGAILERARIRAVRHPGGDTPPEPRYTPTRQTCEFVRCRDLTCRFPGCDKPAQVCDIDHTVPYPAGPTHPSNLKCLCGFHICSKPLRPHV